MWLRAEDVAPAHDLGNDLGIQESPELPRTDDLVPEIHVSDTSDHLTTFQTLLEHPPSTSVRIYTSIWDGWDYDWTRFY